MMYLLASLSTGLAFILWGVHLYGQARGERYYYTEDRERDLAQARSIVGFGCGIFFGSVITGLGLISP